MEMFFSLLRKTNHEFSRFATQMDDTCWIVIAFAALIIGVFILRGNGVRST